MLQWLFNNTTDVDWENLDESTLTEHSAGFMLTSYNNDLGHQISTSTGSNPPLTRVNVYGNYDRPKTNGVQNGGCITLPLAQGKTLDDLVGLIGIIKTSSDGRACAHYYGETLAIYNIALHFAVNDTVIPGGAGRHGDVHRNNIVITIRCNLLLSPTDEPNKYYCDFKFQRLDK